MTDFSRVSALIDYLVHELNEGMYPLDAEAREIANESALDLFDGNQIDHDEYAYTIDLNEG